MIFTMRAVVLGRLGAAGVAAALALSACAGDPSPSRDAGARSPAATEKSAGDASTKNGVTATPVEDPAPDFAVTTFEGDTFSLAEQRGTPVVLNFWESW